MRLLIFGMGFTAKALVDMMQPLGRHTVTATTRNAEKAVGIEALGVTARVFPGGDLTADLARATHVLVTAGPQDGRDPVLAEMRHAFTRAGHLRWVGYLSTTGVYGDHRGGWVDETTALTPATKRGQARVRTEGEWQALMRANGVPLHIFRLPGIYGPGRGPFAKLRAGTARRIIKPGQVFSRIHVDDIAQTLLASMAAPNPGRIYNVCDDDPAPPQDVIGHAAELLGMPVPPDTPFEDADFTPMARSFYAESKRVRNDRIKTELGIRLRHPTYRQGLRAVLDAETAQS